MRISDWSSDVCSSDLVVQRESRRSIDTSSVGDANTVVQHQIDGLGIVLHRHQLLMAGVPGVVGTIVREIDTSGQPVAREERSEEHTSELQSLMRISYAVFCLKKKTNKYSMT